MAPAGVNGGIVVNFSPPADGDSADCVTEGEMLPGGVPAFPTGLHVSDILSNPSGFYVNVHTGEFPGGAVRGQLEAL
jgi:CHRD domain